MKNAGIILVILVLGFITGGCATSTKTAKPVQQSIPSVAEEEVRDEIITSVKKANEFFRKGEFRKAEKIYTELLNRYESEDGRWECAVRTNLCFINLEMGERQRFFRNVEHLKEECREVDFLSRETQFILTLSNHLSNDTELADSSDLRIERQISAGFNTIFNNTGGAR